MCKLMTYHVRWNDLRQPGFQYLANLRMNHQKVEAHVNSRNLVS